MFFLRLYSVSASDLSGDLSWLGIGSMSGRLSGLLTNLAALPIEILRRMLKFEVTYIAPFGFASGLFLHNS